MTPKPDPTAWKVTRVSDGEIDFTDDPPFNHGKLFVCEPLYAHPATRESLIAALAELDSGAGIHNPQDSLLNPATQVFFRAGLIACREYMARFVDVQSPEIAASIRANWWPSLGTDFGAPRKNTFEELTEGEYDTPAFRVRDVSEISPSLEALPIALQFLEQLDGLRPPSQTAKEQP